jgi:hypothetical protein
MKKLMRLACAVALVTLAGNGVAMAQTDDRLEISAFAINMSNIGTGGNASVRITIDKWSSPEERQQLIETMVEKGPDDLLKALQRVPEKGRFSIPGLMGPDPNQLRLGHSLRYTWQTAQPGGGRRIVIITDRYISMREARNQPRTMDYPFTIFEIRVGADGKGEGKMAVATKVTFDKMAKQVELENYSSEPVRLNAVEVKVKK